MCFTPSRGWIYWFVTKDSFCKATLKEFYTKLLPPGYDFLRAPRLFLPGSSLTATFINAQRRLRAQNQRRLRTRYFFNRTRANVIVDSNAAAANYSYRRDWTARFPKSREKRESSLIVETVFFILKGILARLRLYVAYDIFEAII